MAIIKIKDLSVNWNIPRRTIMELSLRQAYFIVSQRYSDKLVETSAKFLEFGKLGRDFYDLVVVGSVRREDMIVFLSNKVLSFCKEYPPYDFVEFIRNFYARDSVKRDSNFNSIFVTLASVVFSGYGCGYLVGSNPEERSIYVEDSMVGPSEAEVLMLTVITSRSGPVKIQHITDDRVELIKFSPKQLERIQKFSALPRVAPFMRDLKNMSDQRLQRIARNFSSSLGPLYFSNFLNLVKDEGYPYYADFYKLAGWEREDTVEVKSVALKLYQVMTDNKFGQDDVLKHRNLYVPDRGVVLRFNDKPDNIDALMLREVHAEGLHMLYISYSVGGAIRFIPFFLDSLDRSFVGILYETDVIAILMTFAFLGISDLMKKNPKELMQMLLSYGNTDITYEEAFGHSSNLSAIIDYTSEYVREDNIRFESPVHWNYENKTKPVSTPWGDTYIVKDRTIGVYTRKLPAGQKSSPEAKKLAEEVFMDLGDDKTIVDEFVRKVKTKVTTINSFGKK